MDLDRLEFKAHSGVSDEVCHDNLCDMLFNQVMNAPLEHIKDVMKGKLDFQLTPAEWLPIIDEGFAKFMPKILENQWFYRFNSDNTVRSQLNFCREQLCMFVIDSSERLHKMHCSQQTFLEASGNIRILATNNKKEIELQKRVVIIPDFYQHPWQCIPLLNDLAANGVEAIALNPPELTGLSMQRVQACINQVLGMCENVVIIAHGSNCKIATDLVESKLGSYEKLVLLNPLVLYKFVHRLPRLNSTQQPSEQATVERTKDLGQITQSPRRVSEETQSDGTIEDEGFVRYQMNSHLMEFKDEYLADETSDNAIAPAMECETACAAIDALNEVEMEADMQSDGSTSALPLDYHQSSLRKSSSHPDSSPSLEIIDTQLSPQDYAHAKKLAQQVPISEQIRQYSQSINVEMYTTLEQATRRHSENLEHICMPEFAIYSRLNLILPQIYRSPTVQSIIETAFQITKSSQIQFIRNPKQIKNIYFPLNSTQRMLQKFLASLAILTIFAPIDFLADIKHSTRLFTEPAFFKNFAHAKIDQSAEYHNETECVILVGSHSCLMTQEILAGVQEISHSEWGQRCVSRTILGAGQELFWLVDIIRQQTL